MGFSVKFLVIGLGSMGKRRIRNLQALGRNSVVGYDPRADRRDEASTRYGIKTYDSYEAALADYNPNALIISTGPSQHMDYALPAVDKGLHCLIEASVVDADRIAELSRLVKGTKLVMAPSCTMRYYPGPRKVKELIHSKKIGKPLNINYHTGQYLPDWHPWVTIQDFYVSKRETGACRELIPFELTWLNDIFGNPDPLACIKGKVTDIDADIDDIYHCLLRYPQGVLANITIEVVSRPRATRELHVLGSEGRLVFSADESCVRYIRAGDEGWSHIALASETIEAGYINPEEPYISEMADFINAMESGKPVLFPNTLEDDVRVLELLNSLEHLSEKTS